MYMIDLLLNDAITSAVIYIYSPIQLPPSQLLGCIDCPGQSRPPLLGLGLSQRRDRDC